MKIILHAGVHSTDEDQLVKCLIRNKDDFLAAGVSVPGPSRYRRLLSDTLNAMDHQTPGPEAREILLDSIIEEDTNQIDRLLLSNENFFCAARNICQDGVLYPYAPARLSRLAELFGEDRIELYLGMRNPASFLPAAFSRTKTAAFETFLDGANPLDLRWADLFDRVRAALPRISITVWCNEDTPLIWGQIIRDMAGLDPHQKIIGAFTVLSQIMSAEGMQRFRTYLSDYPNLTEMQRRRVMVAFLDKFALEDQIVEEIDTPGWTEELINHLTERYDEDTRYIQRMPGVNLITP